MANETRDILSHKPFTVLLFSFSGCPARLLENTVIGHAIYALEPVLTANALKLHSLQAKEKERTAEKLDRSEKPILQKPDADPER